MLVYSVKRLSQSLITIFIVASVVFVLIRLLPTDYYFTEEQLMKLTDAQKEDELLAAGLLDTMPVQLIKYYAKLIKLDFGVSRRLQHGVPVVKLIASKFRVSMKLGLTSVGISLSIGVFMGIIQARNKDKFLDYLGMGYTIFVNAVPNLVSYSLILIFGSMVLGLPPMYSTRNVGPSTILPIVCLSITSIAWWGLWTRRYMIDELNKDYIKLARIKGMPTSKIMTKHILRNAFVPLAQYLPTSILGTIGGSLLVERFFSVPGMGPLLVDSVGRYDTNIVQALVVLYTTLGIVGVFLGDVLMMVVDPRIKLSSKGGTR